MTRVIVDADYLVYSAGFAAQTTRYDVTVERQGGAAEERVLGSMDEVRAFLLDEEEGTYQVNPVVDPEPLQNALHLVNRTLYGIDSHLAGLGIEFDKMELYITGSNNFRDQLATIKPYKGNRDPAHKPYYYKSIRRHLMNRWGAIKVDGYEADDALSMIAHEEGYDPERVVLVSIDKDLRTVPGRHYNFKKKILEDVSHEEALVNFYRQLVTGDATDNIGGAYKAGPKLAEKIIVLGNSEHDHYMAALAAYANGKEKPGCPYQNLSPRDALVENARLLHLKRYPGERWQPPYAPETRSPGARGLNESYGSA